MWNKVYKVMVFCLLYVILFFNVVLMDTNVQTREGLSKILETFQSNEEVCEDCEIYKEEINDLEIELEDTIPRSDNIVFVGNSLIEGLRLNSGSDAAFLSKGGINIDGLKSTIYNSLTYYDCDKVIVGFGSNEMGIFTKEQFIQSYQDLINHIRSINPNSEIIIMSIPPVTRGRSAEGDRYNNENVKLYNTYLVELCEKDKDLVYLDNTPFFTDALNTEWSGDGLHLYDRIYKLWYEFIMKNI